ncbi:MAG: Hpt domain-containing protein, partial [Chitinophagales bacterium]
MNEYQQENLIDLTFLKEFCKDDHEKMANYIHLFLETAPEQMEAMKNLSNSCNWTAVKTVAHTLKPQLAFIGVVNLSPLIEKIE